MRFKLGKVFLWVWVEGGASCQRESMGTVTSWPAASETACVCALGSLWCTSWTWLLARHSYSQAKPEECPGLSVDWRGNVQTELQRADCTGILKHKSVWFWHPTTWFWVMPFSLLFSFFIVITAGYVTWLAGCGVMPVFCAYSGLGRNSGCLLLPNKKSKLRCAQQWKDHRILQSPAFASFFQIVSSGGCCTLSFRQTTCVAIPLSGIPSAAW